jgi:hypothetical protein
VQALFVVVDGKRQCALVLLQTRVLHGRHECNVYGLCARQVHATRVRGMLGLRGGQVRSRDRKHVHVRLPDLRRGQVLEDEPKSGTGTRRCRPVFCPDEELLELVCREVWKERRGIYWKAASPREDTKRDKI